MKKGNIFDLLKLILSFLVVSIHINPLGSQLWYLRHPIVRIAVPLFFMMSSYFFFRKIKTQDHQQQLKSLMNLIKRNFILYFSWFILLWPITYDIWGKRFTLLELFWEIPSRFLLTSTFKSSWYLMALVLGVILIYFITRLTNNKIGFLVGLVCYLICAMLSHYRMLFIDLPFVQAIELFYPYTICYSFPVGLLFICMGKILAEKQQIEVNKAIYIKLIISTVLLFIESYLVITHKWYGETPCYMMLIPFCWYFFICISQIKIEIPYGREIRVISTIMYCFHYSLKYMLYDLITSLGWIPYIYPYSLYFYLLIIGISTILSLTIYKLSQKKYLSILKNLY